MRLYRQMTMKRFRTLVEKHRDWVFSFSYYTLGNVEEAEDTTQEVLMRLWDNLESLREETIPAWLRRVTRNACIDAVRRRGAYRTRIVASGEIEAFSQAVSNEPGPETSAENSELREQIRSAVALLDEPYRSIIVFREIQGMTYNQVSETLQLPLNTVKSYLHRARRALRENLREVLNQ